MMDSDLIMACVLDMTHCMAWVLSVWFVSFVQPPVPPAACTDVYTCVVSTHLIEFNGGTMLTTVVCKC